MDDTLYLTTGGVVANVTSQKLISYGWYDDIMTDQISLRRVPIVVVQ